MNNFIYKKKKWPKHGVEIPKKRCNIKQLQLHQVEHRLVLKELHQQFAH